MASKRKLKRTINNVCNELISESIATMLYDGKQDMENLDAIITAVLRIRRDYVMRLSHPEPGMPPKAYFRDVISRFNEQASEIIDQILNLE